MAAIRVYIQRDKVNTDPLIAAQKKFQRLGVLHPLKSVLRNNH